ncbi:hypothetical protein MD484_g2928, partial [Candolleomyces efflorescens]
MTTTTTKKRKATSASAGTASKKSKLGEEGADQVKEILADASNADSELLKLAQYARWLEEEITALKPKPKSADDIENEAEKLRASVRSGIVKQMGWKPSCKTSSSKWVYDGVCNDPAVFGHMLGLDGPPAFKMKKMKKDEFQDAMGGDVSASIRYGRLYQHGDIAVRWPGDGTFKLSGTYGLPRSGL